MTTYRFFLLNLQGSVIDGTLQDCVDDLGALDKARNLCAASAIEIWHESRHVALVKMGDAPLNIQDRVSL